MVKSVLVVDDEQMTRTLLQLMLASAEYEVLEASDGFEALEKIAKQKPDIIVLDVMMPNMDGITLCHKLRSREDDTADIPVILLSAKTNPEAIQEGLFAGANRYLTKPVSRKDLLESLAELLSSVSVLLK
ncbi:MAG: response regulator [Chloroflexi bacterium]|nr:MAG: response regulator [Chloroflexota bacterium]PIE80899.1 MAG: response regulator [Chloroflexota bacterium]